MSLVTRMVAVTALGVLVATLAGGVSAYLVASSALEEEIKFAGETLAHSLSGSIITVINKPGGEGELQVALNQLLARDRQGRIQDAYIISREQRVLAAKDASEAGKPFTRFAGLAQVHRAQAMRIPGSGTAVAAPVQWGKEHKRTLGYVVFFINEQVFTAARDRILASFSTLFLLAVLATFVITRYLVARMLRPVVALGEAARQLAAGNSEYALAAPPTEDEIGVATRSFLSMREAQKWYVRFSNPALVHEIMAGRAPDHPEEVKLTIGFGDGVRFTDWSSAHTAAEISTLLTDYFTLFGLLVAQHHGIVEKFIGDAVMTYYGLHTGRSAQEDARNAIRVHVCGQFALNMANRAFAKYHRRIPLRFRFGIASGKCVVGPMGARGVKLDYTILGNIVNLASRLEGLAEAGGLVIDNFTFSNAGREEFVRVEGPDTHRIKGIPQPVPVYRVRGLTAPEEEMRCRALLLDFFTRPEVEEVLRLSPPQMEAFRRELEARLEAPGIVLPTEPAEP